MLLFSKFSPARFFIITSLLLLMSQHLKAQSKASNKGTIKGSVTDEKKITIPTPH